MLRPCLGGCGSLVATIERTGRCKNCRRASETHRPSRQTPGRGGGHAAGRFRDEVLRRAGYQCEAVEDGKRCEVRGAALQAHHVVGIVNGGDADDVENGRALCRRHHELTEALTRAGTSASTR